MANITDVATPSAAPDLDTAATPANGGPPAAAAPPARPSRRWNWKKWRARLVVVLMIAGAVAGGSQLAQSRGTTIAQFDLGTVTLTGQAIPVASTRTGQVSDVAVKAQEKVEAGQRLGTLITTTTTATGKEQQKPVALTAPADGIVIADPEPVGSIVPLGQPFAQMYDPARLTLTTNVPVDELPRLSTGMIATLHADGLNRPVEAVVQRVVPRVDTEASTRLPSGQDRLQLVLVPRRAADVEQLVPGLRFTGTVDTESGTGSARDVLHVTS